jgi:hypothetical protein
MKTQIDIKSALVGILIGVLVVTAIGAGTSSNEVGRYKVSCGAAFAVMVDTKTGQAWGIARDTQSRNDGDFFTAK